MKTLPELAAILGGAAESYHATKGAHAQAMIAESQAILRWTTAAGAHGVGSAEEIAAFADWAALAEDTELADALLNVARITLRRARRDIPAAPGAARA